jgi:hypothetical protein
MNFGVIAIVPPHAGASAPNVRAVASVILSKAVCKSPSTKVLFLLEQYPILLFQGTVAIAQNSVSNNCAVQ